MADPEVGCLVVTGSGNAFCAGGDLRSMEDRGAVAVRGRMAATWDFVLPLLTREKPVIAAVNGAAVGAGLSLALLADIVLAPEEATFRAGFPSVGAVPDLGLGYTLPRALGMARAREILLTNRLLDAQTAASIGLVAAIHPGPKLLPEAMALAARLANGPASLGLSKTLLDAAFRLNPADYLALEALLQAQAFATEDFGEGVSAFLEKRRPVFPHR